MLLTDKALDDWVKRANSNLYRNDIPQNNSHVVLDEGSKMPSDMVQEERKIISNNDAFVGGNEGAEMPTEFHAVDAENKGRIITPEQTFGDKRIVHPYGYAPGNKESRSFFDRWREHSEWVAKEYPLVRWDKIGDVPKIPINYVKSEIFGYLSEQLGERDNVLKEIVGTFLDVKEQNSRQLYKALPFDIFPRIKTLTAFSNSYTDVHKMFTIEKDGKEYPIYFQMSKMQNGQFVVEDIPAIDRIEKAAEFVDQFSTSPYNKVRNVENFIDDDFIKYAVEKYTRGDFSRYFQDEPHIFRRWLIKDDTWMIYQYGKRDEETEAIINGSLTNPAFSGRIRVYDDPGKRSGFWYNLGKLLGDESPSSWESLVYWQIGDWTYDFVDLLFSPAEEAFERLGVPASGMRRLQDIEYRIIAGARRGMFDPRGDNFTYEKPGLSMSIVKEAEKRAKEIGYA